jgi:putative solute:sodium symporter small subunit
MIDEEQRPRYWRHTFYLASGMVALIVVCAFVLPMFAAELNTDSLLSFPLGYFFAAQGVMIVLIVAVYWAGSRQAETDRKFGAMDDL